MFITFPVITRRNGVAVRLLFRITEFTFMFVCEQNTTYLKLRLEELVQGVVYDERISIRQRLTRVM
jgi:hypothetical protein